MLRTGLLALVVAFLCGCENNAEPQASSDLTEESRSAEQEDSALLGYEVYQEFCASCHDAGKEDTPVTGNPADWNDRSELWMAVLAEHVEAGYLSMPAKGGHPELTDLGVKMAVEHMMLRTFPEKTRD
jgi:cytochrome c5